MLPPVTSFESVDFSDGALLLIDKPKGWTSFDVVNKIRHLIRRRYALKKIKVGHAGTLDPMATGLLLICTGKWTKELHQLQGLDKRYIAGITLGMETDTYDAEGQIVDQRNVPELTNTFISDVVNKFEGEYEQIPPVFSAIKKEGKPLYKLAREGKEVIPEARKVVVHSIRILSYVKPVLSLEIHCGSGFYVRSLAHDIGEMIGSGAHLSSLCRTVIGPYDIKDAMSMESFIAQMA